MRLRGDHGGMLDGRRVREVGLEGPFASLIDLLIHWSRVCGAQIVGAGAVGGGTALCGVTVVVSSHGAATKTPLGSGRLQSNDYAWLLRRMSWGRLMGSAPYGCIRWYSGIRRIPLR